MPICCGSSSVRSCAIASQGRKDVVTRIDAGGYSEAFGYNGFRQVTTHTDQSGFVWDNGYDANGNRTDYILPDEDANLVDPETRENNPHWVYTFDTKGNMLSQEPSRCLNTTRRII